MKHVLSGSLEVWVKDASFVEHCKWKCRTRPKFFEMAEFNLVTIMNLASHMFGENLDWNFRYEGDFPSQMYEFLWVVIADGVCSVELSNFIRAC